jgi:hypothetical protein
MNRERWIWLLALLVGGGLGLYYAWVVAPVRYVDTLPNTLRSDFKDQYRLAISASYAVTHNLVRTRARLALLGDADPVQALTAQAQRMLAQGESFDSIQEVAALASDLRSGVVNVLPPPSSTLAPTFSRNSQTGTSTLAPTETITLAASLESPTIEPSATPAIFDTSTPRPTRTPSPTAGAPFQLISQDTVCKLDLTEGLMQISVIDSRHHQLAGVEIIISWNGGEEHIFTGFKPEIANGYADYVMLAGVTYTIRIADSGAPVPNITAPTCSDSSGQSYLGGLHLTFQQP